MLVRIRVLGWRTGDRAEPKSEEEVPESAEPWLGGLLGIWTWWKIIKIKIEKTKKLRN